MNILSLMLSSDFLCKIYYKKWKETSSILKNDNVLTKCLFCFPFNQNK